MMRDLLEEISSAQPLDPNEAARRSMGPRRRRFYQQVEVRPSASGYGVVLDGRVVRTPARAGLIAPNVALAEALAAEWSTQREFIDPANMPLTRLCNTIIDGVAAASRDIVAEIEKYLGCDLVCYRATGPEALRRRQALHWDPVMEWARETHGAHFVVGTGVTFARQPDEAMTAMRAVIPHDPWRLGAVHAVTTLTGSALIALMLADQAITVEAAWMIAHVDEDWNFELWGRDELAATRRNFRFAEMTAAAKVLADTAA